MGHGGGGHQGIQNNAPVRDLWRQENLRAQTFLIVSDYDKFCLRVFTSIQLIQLEVLFG